MKTATQTYPISHFVDLTPLSPRFAFLTRAVMVLIEAGQMGVVERCTQKIVRLVQEYTKLSARNILLARKLDMLSDAQWRARVLSQLGGFKRLSVWERARERVLAQGDRPLPEQDGIYASWLYTPERLAESERLKAHVRKCAQATVSPYIVRDRVRVDDDGMFRLPPLSRLKTGKRQIKVYTGHSISDYDFNAIPFYEEKGFGPAVVWPAEFYAAMRVEAKFGKVQRRESEEKSESESTPPASEPNMRFNLPPRFYSLDCHVNSRRQSDVEPKTVEYQLPTIPLHSVVSVKNYQYIFENPV